MKLEDEDIVNALKSSFSIAETMRKLGVGLHYRIMHTHIKRLNVDTSHFRSTSGGYQEKKELTYYLKENSCSTSTSHLKKRLIREKYLENKCSICEIYEWNNKPLSLHLDHINGTPTDNRLENLRLLCPNCHSQTATYCGKNAKKIKDNKCQDCGIKVWRQSKRCKTCHYNKIGQK